MGKWVSTTSAREARASAARAKLSMRRGAGRSWLSTTQTLGGASTAGPTTTAGGASSASCKLQK